MSSRVANALMGNVGPQIGHMNATSNLQYGGMNGYVPQLEEWVNNQQYIRQNLIPVLIDAPTGFQVLPNPDTWLGILKALVELHPLAITGLQGGLTVDFQGTPVGGGGQQQEDPTDVKETPSNISFRWNEKYGMPVNRFLDNWIRLLIKDPNSKFAAVNTLDGVKLPDMMADRYAMTMMFIEPDPTHTQVVKAWLVANMWPKSSGEVTGQHDKTAAGEQVNYDVEFAGICQTGLGVKQFAQKILDGMKITGADPYHRAAFIQQISADVLAQSKGYQNNLEQISQTGVKV